jgi:glycerol-3-phosphate dehydrogenase (NAD+)
VQDGKPRSFEELEGEVLKGQKLQGTLTSNEVQEILRARNWETEYPLFTTVNRWAAGRCSQVSTPAYTYVCLQAH